MNYYFIRKKKLLQKFKMLLDSTVFEKRAHPKENLSYLQLLLLQFLNDLKLPQLLLNSHLIFSYLGMRFRFQNKLEKVPLVLFLREFGKDMMLQVFFKK